jgi:hypothetical protein
MVWGVPRLEVLRVGLDIHHHQFLARDVKQLLAIAAPAWFLSSSPRDLPFMLEGGKL